MEIIKLSASNHTQVIAKATAALKNNGLVIFPTETCYGAGVLATRSLAVDKLLAYKTRREGKPLSIAVSDKKMASKYVEINTSASNLYQNFLPGPLTVVSKGLHKVAKGVESETGTLGVRIPDYPLIVKLVKKLNLPITATSANASYKPRPYSITKLLKNLSIKQQKSIDLIIDAGTLPKRPASTVVDTTLEDPLVLRQGKISFGHKQQLTSKSPQDTINLALSLALKHWKDLQKKPVIFLLNGDLGAGKTQFAKGLGQFLQIKDVITSPTYTIESEYPYTRHKVSGLFLHLDTWRFADVAEFYQLNLESRLKAKTMVAIEWANRTQDPILKLAQKTNAVVVNIDILPSTNPNHRRISISQV